MSNKRPKLSKHTKAIVRMKLAGEKSNVQIAKELGISDERVRQIWLFWIRRNFIRNQEALREVKDKAS